ncbi:gem-associated protein 2 [Parasteatoda tepidariorum]|uniref:gem-associated protein 2 n=1 Tax=Parasteatoda tepidariorum TaxID=114398 RepID=UPI001C71D51C|nr:gem-associated protein 2 [Parasteatoda tepidariorum]
MSDPYLKRAFALDDIDPDDIDLNSNPTTGMDYLYRVRLETRQCPKVVVANIDTAQFINKQTVQVDIYSGFIAARPGYEPDPDWQELVMDDFRSHKTHMTENRIALKEKFRRRPVPKINQAEEWCLYCLGVECHKKVYCDDTASEISDSEKSGPQAKRSRLSTDVHLPFLSVMAHLDQNRIKKLLSYFDTWLDDINFSHQVGKWIYALLVCLEKPLDPNTCSLLRNLSKHCCRFRDSLSSPDDKLLISLNMIITIIAYHFDQKDLCDNFRNFD